jgi:hypothetical protein
MREVKIKKKPLTFSFLQNIDGEQKKKNLFSPFVFLLNIKMKRQIKTASVINLIFNPYKRYQESFQSNTVLSLPDPPIFSTHTNLGYVSASDLTIERPSIYSIECQKQSNNDIHVINFYLYFFSFCYLLILVHSYQQIYRYNNTSTFRSN